MSACDCMGWHHCRLDRISKCSCSVSEYFMEKFGIYVDKVLNIDLCVLNFKWYVVLFTMGYPESVSNFKKVIIYGGTFYLCGIQSWECKYKNVIEYVLFKSSVS